MRRIFEDYPPKFPSSAGGVDPADGGRRGGRMKKQTPNNKSQIISNSQYSTLKTDLLILFPFSFLRPP